MADCRIPFPQGGTNSSLLLQLAEEFIPKDLLATAGARYVYVVNKGDATTGGNISLYSVGGDGVLTFQQSFTSRGSIPVWATVDSTGNFLYVLDTLYPDTPQYPNPNGLGDITVFGI